MEEKRVRDKKGKNLLSVPSDYVVIDLETTGLDPQYNEIIEVAGLHFIDGIEQGRFHSLVKPQEEIDEFITELTGISNSMVSDAPQIETILPEFLNFIGNSIVIGHNVNFDINFLYDYAEELSLPSVSNDFVDTLRLSRFLYKDIKNHKLQTLITYLGVAEKLDHRALSDCSCTQKCYAIMKQHVEQNNIDLKPKAKDYGSLSKSINPESDVFDEDTLIYNAAFAFTGKLERMTRREAMQAVANAGGICCDKVTSNTNYLVLGNNDYCKSIKGGKSSKQKKAERMQLDGFDIAIISEDVFYDMLPAPSNK